MNTGETKWSWKSGLALLAFAILLMPALVAAKCWRRFKK